MVGRVVTVRTERTADVFAVHHDLAERDVRGPGGLRLLVMIASKRALHVGRRAAVVVLQIALDELVELEPGLDEAREEVRRGDVARRGQMRDEILDVPLVAPASVESTAPA